MPASAYRLAALAITFLTVVWRKSIPDVDAIAAALLCLTVLIWMDLWSREGGQDSWASLGGVMRGIGKPSLLVPYAVMVFILVGADEVFPRVNTVPDYRIPTAGQGGTSLPSRTATPASSLARPPVSQPPLGPVSGASSNKAPTPQARPSPVPPRPITPSASGPVPGTSAPAGAAPTPVKVVPSTLPASGGGPSGAPKQ